MDDGVESVDRVSGVIDGPHCAVRLHQAVAALDDVSTAALLLALRVAGQSVLDVVSIAVLGVGVVVGVDGHGGGGGGIGEGSGVCCVGQRARAREYCRGTKDTSTDCSHQGGEGEELWVERERDE